MRTLALDFVRRHRRSSLVGWVLLAAALAAAGHLGLRFHERQGELARLELRLERTQSRVESGTKIDPKRAQALAEEMRRAQAITRQIGLPWGDLFAAVEAAATPRVALLALQPDAGQSVVRITAESKEFADALEFVRRLAASRQLRDVHLASHQVQAQDAMRPIRFIIVASFAAKANS